MKTIFRLATAILFLGLFSNKVSAQVAIRDAAGNRIDVNSGSVKIKSVGSTAASGGSVVVNGHGQTKSISCEGKTVIISGSQNVIRLNGNAANITMSGSQNKVTVDGVAAVTASGSNNSLVYLHTINNRKPAVSIAGTHNSVSQRKP